MNGRCRFWTLTLFLTFTACSNEDPALRAIRAQTDVVDLVIDQSKPNQIFTDESNARVGILAEKHETRLLLYFPKISELFDEETILTSITQVEVLIHTEDVAANPENVQLSLVGEPWTGAATWNSRSKYFRSLNWQESGGTIDTNFPPVSPTLRSSGAKGSGFELAFDVTNIIIDLISKRVSNHGFIIRVLPSELNEQNFLPVFGYRKGRDEKNPSAILAYTEREIVAP